MIPYFLKKILGLVLKNGKKVGSLAEFQTYLKGLKDATEVKDFSGALFSFIKIR